MKGFNKIILSLLLLTLSSSLFAQKKEVYISPNNDGIQDEFVLPIKISDKRLITAWQLVITDENDNVIRTIGNKVALPSGVTFKSFFKQLVTPKVGVEIPETVTWNGTMDNGETAPDGNYYYYFTATDENDNTGKTSKRLVVVDTKSPEIDLTQPTDKIFGEGVKSDFRIKQSGSKEDKWIGNFKNSVGEVVKTFTWENDVPDNFNWNGTDNKGQIVPDGVYSYEISATDRAGNTNAQTSITNIIYSAEKPATNILINGSRYFSPETDSKLSTIKFEVQIPVPAASSGNKLSEWKVSIVGSDGKIYRTYKGDDKNLPPSEIIFDGKDDNKARLPEGKYQATVSAKYLNGYVPAIIRSPAFILDITKPSAQIAVSDKVFGAGTKDKVSISMLITPKVYATVPSWTGKIINTKDSSVVKEYNFGEFPPESISWNGFASSGSLAQDGKYKFQLSGTDLAGNTGVIVSEDDFELNTKTATVLLSASDIAFSPNGNKVKDTISFKPVLKDVDAIASYEFKVLDSKGTAVKTISDTKVIPSNFVWDGKANDGIICPDGTYSATLKVVSANGSVASVNSAKFALDTVAPKVVAKTPWSIFSPDKDGNQDVIPISISDCSTENLWTAEVKNSKGIAVKKYSWKGKIRSATSDYFEWDGSNESGNKAADGIYSIVISSEDAAGNKFSTALNNLTMDSRETKAYVIAELEGISPNGDKVLDTQKFNIKTSVPEGILSWNFDIRSENGTSIRGWSEKDSANLPATIIWDGLDSSGKPAEGTYTGTLKIAYKKGNLVQAISTPFICSATPPMLSVKTAPKYFSPDNDGVDDDLFIKLSGSTKALIKNWSFTIYDPLGKTFWKTNGTKAITERIIWDGLSNVQKNASGFAERVQSATDYPYEFKVTDSLGMTSVVKGNIAVDVLVIRDGSVLKMAVPSIIFRSDNADFKTVKEIAKGGLALDKAENNEKVLKRIAQILNKFKDYNVTIVGHANRVTDNEEEETVDNPQKWGPALIPLSAKRAEFVKAYLVKQGISASRLSTEGKGGTELVVDYQDKDNNWKNRRVEFILNK